MSIRRTAARELARSQENPDSRNSNEQTDENNQDDERECVRVCESVYCGRVVILFSYSPWF